MCAVVFCAFCRLRMAAEKDLRNEQEKRESEAAEKRRKAREGEDGFRWGLARMHAVGCFPKLWCTQASRRAVISGLHIQAGVLLTGCQWHSCWPAKCLHAVGVFALLCAGHVQLCPSPAGWTL